MTPPALPERLALRRRLWSVVRPVLAWSLALLGALALFLGWYGVSGTAVPAKQLPYLVSGGLTGVALVVLAAAVFAADDVRRRFAHLDRVERKVDELYALLTEEDLAPPTEGYVAVEGGTSFHVPSCRLVLGKATTRELSRRDVVTSGLAPCRVCDPPAVVA
jgi:membrane protein implicated in regulation of membrane protease activity